MWLNSQQAVEQSHGCCITRIGPDNANTEMTATLICRGMGGEVVAWCWRWTSAPGGSLNCPHRKCRKSSTNKGFDSLSDDTSVRITRSLTEQQRVSPHTTP